MELKSCQSSTKNTSKQKKWNKLLEVLENESYTLMKKTDEIESSLRNCRLKLRLLRLSSHIEMYGTSALCSNRSTRNRKRRSLEIENFNSDAWCSKVLTKDSKEGIDLWTPDVGDETGNFSNVPCYVPPVESNEVDALYAFNFRGDDSRKKTLQLKITARIIPLSMTNIKRNVDVEAASKALKGYTHNWSLMFTPLNKETSDFIDKIVVYLHPTCDEQFVVLKFSKKKKSASISQYGWGSFKARVLYHFIFPEFNRPVEQIFDLDFIINQISGFERIAHISVCDLEKDDIRRVKKLHTDDRESSSSSESEENLKPLIKKCRLSEDESYVEDGIPLDDIFSYNNIAADPYSGVLFSPETLDNLGQFPHPEKLGVESSPECSQYSAATTVNSSQSTLTQSDTIKSDPDLLNILESSADDNAKQSFQSSILHSSRDVSFDSIKCESSFQSSLTQSDSLLSDSYSPNILESFDSYDKSNLSFQSSILHLSSKTSSNCSSNSESSESSTMLNTNIPQQFKSEKLQTDPFNDSSDSSLFLSQSSSESSKCSLEFESSPSLLKNVSASELKVSPINVTNNCHSKLKPAFIVPEQPKRTYILAQALNSAGKILIKHDGKSKLIRIIKAGSTSLLKKPPNPIFTSTPTSGGTPPQPIPTPNLIAVTNVKEDEHKLRHIDENLKGTLSHKLVNVRRIVSGMNFEDGLIFCMKNYPIVTKEASNKIYKQLHPYASRSSEEFLSWKFGKRAASMSKHARFIHGILIENCRDEPWSWVQVRQYIKYHGYVPIKKINGVYKPPSFNLKTPRTSLTCLKLPPNIAQLKKLRSEMEEVTCIVDVDDSVQIGEVQSSSKNTQSCKLSTTINDSIKDYTGLSPGDLELCKLIIRTNEMFNLHVNNDFVPEILLSIFKSFAKFILRRSLAAMMNRKRRHNIIREKDVLTCVSFSEKLRILTGNGLGKKPLKCTIQSY